MFGEIHEAAAPSQVYPPRRSINGHDPDCPFGGRGDPEYCNVCQGIAKGGLGG